jgi:hypothetical protein
MKINSNVILAVGYDAKASLLEIKFRISKRVYAYLNVPQKVYEDFMHARSKGSFFNQKIKNNYEHVLLKL